MNIYKRIFIVGCPRSGTTLLQTELSKHKKIITFPESHFFGRSFLSPKSRKFPTLYSNYVFYKWTKELNEVGINLKYKLSFSRNSVVKTFIGELDRYAMENGKTIWIEKTPSHLKSIEIIKKYLSDAIFIHIIRDGRDVVASLVETTNKFREWGVKYTIDDAVKRYNNDLIISKQYSDKRNHLIVKYENLLLDNSEIENVFRYLNIDNTLMYEESEVDKIILKNEPWKNNNYSKKKIDTSLKKFSTVFSEGEKKYIESNLVNWDEL